MCVFTVFDFSARSRQLYFLFFSAARSSGHRSRIFSAGYSMADTKRRTVTTESFEILLKLEFSDGCGCPSTHIKVTFNLEVSEDGVNLDKKVVLQNLQDEAIRDMFDGNFVILTVDDVADFKPAGLWLNIQYDAFYSQHKNYVISLSRRVVINYISSSEVGFLRSIASPFNPNVTKLVFQFLHPDDVEPSTNQTYSSHFKNLSFIKTFASGITIRKDYVWPVDSKSYLLPHTSIVLDAHKAALQDFIMMCH